MADSENAQAPRPMNNPWAPQAQPVVSTQRPMNNPWSAQAQEVQPTEHTINNPWPNQQQQGATAPRAMNNPWATKEPSSPQPDGHWYHLITRPTQSVIQDFSGEDVAESGRKKIMGAIKSVLPESMQGSYATEFADEISKAGPGIVNFATSPVGIGLMAAHMFPASAPFAGLADLYFGGTQALNAIPDTIAAVKDIKNPRKAAQAMVDVLGAYAGIKGGSKVMRAMGDIPADTKPGLPMVRAYADAFRKTSAPPSATAGQELRRSLEAAPSEEDKAALIAEAEKPTTIRGQLEQRLYRTPIVRSMVNVLAPKVEQPPILSVGQSMVDEYVGRIASEENKARRVKDFIERNVPEADQNIRRMGYAMEGDIPESELSPAAREGLEKIRELTRSRDTMLRESGADEDSLRDPNTYIRHYWDFEDGNSPARKYAIASRMMKDPSLRSRTIGSLKIGISPEEEGGYGLTPKYENIGDVIYRRHVEAVRSAENQKFADKLKDFGLIQDPTKANMRSLGTWEIASDAPALKRAVYGGTNEQGETVLREKPPLVHPDIAMAVKAIFDEPLKGGLVNAANQITSFTKQIGVGFSLFHNNAMSEVAQAHAVGAGGASAPERMVKSIAWPLDKEFIKGATNAIWEVRGKVAPEAPPDVRLARDVVEPWLQANLTFKSAESEGAAINSLRNLWQKEGPILRTLSAPLRAIGDAQYIFNRALFDYYLPGQMLNSAEHLMASEMNRLGSQATPEQVTQLRQEIADHVNRSFGADNMQRLLLTPKAQQALRFTLFAPQWTLSNLRVLSKGYETTTGARLTNRYVAGSALVFFLTSQLANYALSAWYGDPKRHPEGGGEYFDENGNVQRGGHFTWQNPGDPLTINGKDTGLSTNAVNIYFGQNPDGSQRYIRLNKAAREPFGWMTDPLKTFLGKMALPIRQALVQATKVEPGSGYPVIDSTLTDKQQMEQRIGSVLETVTPFSARELLQRSERWADPKVFRDIGSTSQYLGLPARKGASFFNSVAAYREALEADRPDMAEQVLRNAVLNKISAKSIQAEVKKRLMRETRTEAGRTPQNTQMPQ